MNTSVFVEAIAGAVALIVAALSYLFTKVKEREADWRKWKYEQYKEFMASISGNLSSNSTPDGKKRFSSACNALYLIGSKGVLLELNPLLAAVAGQPGLSRVDHDALLSKVVWEIRKDLDTPGTPDKSEFSIHLWGPGLMATDR